MTKSEYARAAKRRSNAIERTQLLYEGRGGKKQKAVGRNKEFCREDKQTKEAFGKNYR